MRTHDCLLLLLFLVSLTFTTFTSCLPIESSIIAKTNDFLLKDERVQEIFEEWKKQHGKVYQNSLEAGERFRIFRDNLEYIAEQNSLRISPRQHVLGLNKFADLTNEEFGEKYISKIKNVRRRAVIRSVVDDAAGVSCEAPPSVDWRERGVVTGVKDQGPCGSSWAFSSTGALEGANALATGDLISLSEQELMDCDTNNDGCDGGSMDCAFEWVISNGGIASGSNYPYTGLHGTCNITTENRKIANIDGYTNVAEEENALFCAVAKQPVSVAMDGSARDFQLYAGGIYDGECSDNPNDMDHAVLIVGYGSEDGEDYWIVKNSWGTAWGIEGYAYIRRNTNSEYGVCGINAGASYPTKEPSSTPSRYPSLVVYPRQQPVYPEYAPPPPQVYPVYPPPSSPPPPSLPPPTPTSHSPFTILPSISSKMWILLVLCTL